VTSSKSPGAVPVLVFASFLALVAVPQIASFWVDWLWFGSVGFAQVFTTSFTAQAFWSLAGGLLGLAVTLVSHLAMARATGGAS